MEMEKREESRKKIRSDIDVRCIPRKGDTGAFRADVTITRGLPGQRARGKVCLILRDGLE